MIQSLYKYILVVSASFTALCIVVVIFYFELVILVCVTMIFFVLVCVTKNFFVLVCITKHTGGDDVWQPPRNPTGETSSIRATCCRALVRNRQCDIAFQLFSQYNKLYCQKKGRKENIFWNLCINKESNGFVVQFRTWVRNPYSRKDTPCILSFYCSYSY